MISLDKLPSLPGCYLFKDDQGSVLYVGKAKDLKKRVASYFQKPDPDLKTSALIQSACSLDFIVTNTEVEALLLENTLIKKHWPHYNVKLKDSSRYACIHLTDEKYPRIRISRKNAGKGSFFGPFTSSQERTYIFRILRKTFGLRTCKKLPKRACLRYHLGHCTAPCIGKIAESDYLENAKRAEFVLCGKTGELIASLREEMEDLSGRQEFERALKLREDIAALERLQERQSVEHRRKYDQDVLSYEIDNNSVYLMIFKVFRGTLQGKEDFVFAWSDNFLEQFIVQYYSENEPAEELIISEPLDESLVEFLTHVKRKKVRVTVPKRGEKKELLDLAKKNVEIGLFGDRNKLRAVQEALNLPKLPSVVECFDVSHLSGTSMVGSMVQFRSGRPDKNNYRRFKIKSVDGIDDFAAIGELVCRRYSRLKEEKQELPDLIVIDGGLGQLSSAQGQLRELRLKVPIISIAKQEEKIYVPGRSQPLPLERDDCASLFIQEIRDEAHRFAINYNRLLRKKSVLS